MAQPHDVDRTAPVLAHHEIDIDAPLERVWALHTHVDGWPEWQTDVTEARIEGPFGPGTSFDWTSYRFSVRSTIHDVDANSRVLWGGAAEGITGIHEWLFSETPGGVHVETNESFAGAPVEAHPTSMQSILDGSLAAWLGHLKAPAEAKA